MTQMHLIYLMYTGCGRSLTAPPLVKMSDYARCQYKLLPLG